MLRRLLLGLVVGVVVVLVVADRVGAVVAAHVLADKIQTDEGLSSRPEVSIGGFPFLTQAIRGDYSNVTVTAHHLVLGGVPVSRLTVHLHGAHLPLHDALSGNAHQVPVDSTDGQLLLSYPDVNHYLAPKHLTVQPAASGQVRVTQTLSIAGQRLTVSGIGRASVRHDVITATTTSVAAGASGSSVSVPARLSASLPMLGIPFRLTLGEVHATTAGVIAAGTVNRLVIGKHP